MTEIDIADVAVSLLISATLWFGQSSAIRYWVVRQPLPRWGAVLTCTLQWLANGIFFMSLAILLTILGGGATDGPPPKFGFPILLIFGSYYILTKSEGSARLPARASVPANTVTAAALFADRVDTQTASVASPGRNRDAFPIIGRGLLVVAMMVSAICLLVGAILWLNNHRDSQSNPSRGPILPPQQMGNAETGGWAEAVPEPHAGAYPAPHVARSAPDGRAVTEATGGRNEQDGQATSKLPEGAGEQLNVVDAPDWRRLPSGDDINRYYPDRASRMEIEGRATISCQVNARGTLEGCSVVSEEPGNMGFGDAAMKMSKLFKMRPQTKDGQPVDGGTVRIPIRFSLPKG